VTSELPATPMTVEERTYVVLRIAVLPILLVLLYFPGIDPLKREIGLWALLASTVATVFLVGMVVRGRRSVARMMFAVLPADLLAVGVYTALLAKYDGFYPVCIVLAVFYAVIQERRDALMAAVALTIAYVIGHAIFPPEDLMMLVLVALKSLTIVIVGWVVASAMVTRREREREIVAEGIERSRINRQLERRVSELQAVSEITEVIHSSLDFDAVGAKVLDIVAKVIGISAIVVFVLNKERSETLFTASVGMPHDGNWRGGSELGLGEVEAHMTCIRVFDHGPTMVLFCASPEDMDGLTDEDRLVINAVASELVVAVENSRLYKLTQRLAITDELTGMSNYRHLQQRLDEEVLRAKRYGKFLSLIMMDADDFKHYNDRYGHIAGDRALGEFARVLASVLREVDVLARYGGEEFAVVLPETDAAGAYVVAEKIREELAAHRFVDADGQRCCTLTVSVGVATYPTYAFDKESLLREADDALYRAKNGGKNRVCAPKRTSEPDTTHGE
jgi:diguanylate cyclase (GGDEF)-like protein